VLFLLVVFTAANASAGETSAAQAPDLLGKRLLVVAPESFPYHYSDIETGRPVGSDITMVRELSKAAGLSPPDILIVSWNRAIREARSTPATVVMPLSRSTARDAEFHWLIKLRTTEFGVFGLEKQMLSPKYIVENDISIFCENGGIQCQLLEDLGIPKEQIKLFPGISSDKVVSMALRGRIRYFISEIAIVDAGLKKRNLPPGTLTQTYTLPDTVDDYLAIHKKNDPALIKALTAAASKFSNN